MLGWITKQMRDWPEIKRLFKSTKDGSKTLVQGITGMQKPLLLAALWPELTGSLLLLTHSPSEAERLFLDLQGLINPRELSLFPAYDLLAHEEAYEEEVTGARLSVLSTLVKNQRQLVVTSWAALSRRLIPPDVFRLYLQSLEVGQEAPRGILFANLVRMGFERTEKIYTFGQFSVRGDIVDIYPPDLTSPVRVEFFGDEIDSIRQFDIETQKSAEKMEKVEILPAREGLWTSEEFRKARPWIERSLEEQSARFIRQGAPETGTLLTERFNEALEKIEEGVSFPGKDRFLPLIRKDLSPMWEYLSEGVLVLDEPVRGSEYQRALEEENAQTLSGFLERGLILPEESSLYLPFSAVQSSLGKQAVIQMSVLPRSIEGTKPDQVVILPMKAPPEFFSRFNSLVEELKDRTRREWAVGITISGPERLRHFSEQLRDEGLEVFSAGRGQSLFPGRVFLVDQALSAGVEFTREKTLLLSEAEIFGRFQKKRKVRARFAKEGVRLTDLGELELGDYVVHINHGIGRYRGIKKMEISGAKREYLEVEYAAGDRLFVPTDQVHLIQKYVGVEESLPKINRLGGGDWQKVKNRVKESIQEMAEKLLVLYADRLASKGFVFSPDTVWQKEFEEAFIYEETPDQVRATEEIKKDMESPRPMDRLLCGDVGYGKTEVAMRAAFKAIMDSKQVAVLVPTTILAQQHYQTFGQRFSGYPIKIAVLSRFQSPGQQEAVIKGLKEGQIDLVIGTHRLLSKDVVLRDLGLLIVDEEQKFGVAHKERLKEFRKNVDVLTLTATPIPRTLHMSMIGIRDMSVIETPPEDRYPVRTYVSEFNEEVIAEAIRRELDRNGQVFFVYNRVGTIERMAEMLQRLIPEARIEIAHGQMSEDALEEVMLSFYEGSADILVCTTIIENGLDIPNVNTLIAYDADRLGLSQLYQLRGRVGRSNRVAYAYFTYRRDKILSEAAEKRLTAIRDFTALGSGFKIALRDLEIRGAGNLLGPEQHGYIASIGFDLYCRLLEEAIKERRGEKKPELPEPTIELPFDAFIPETYIPDSRQKVEIYKKIAAIESLEGADEVEEEMEDRFGTIPLPAMNLLETARLKALSRRLGVGAITSERGEIIARILPGISIDAQILSSLLVQYKGRFRYQPGRQIVIRWKIAGYKTREIWTFVKESLSYLLERQSAERKTQHK